MTENNTKHTAYKIAAAAILLLLIVSIIAAIPAVICTTNSQQPATDETATTPGGQDEETEKIEENPSTHTAAASHTETSISVTPSAIKPGERVTVTYSYAGFNGQDVYLHIIDTGIMGLIDEWVKLETSATTGSGTYERTLPPGYAGAVYTLNLHKGKGFSTPLATALVTVINEEKQP